VICVSAVYVLFQWYAHIRPGAFRPLQHIPKEIGMLWLNKLQMKLGGVQARIKAIQQMGESNDPRAVEMIAKESLDDGSSEVQQAAAEMLGRMGDARALETLSMMLEVGTPPVQAAAATAMMEIGDPRAVPFLTEALKGPNTEVREAVIAGLVKLGAASAPQLVASLKEMNRFTRAGAVVALVQIGEPAIASLSATFEDKAPEAREAAAEILAKMGPPAVPGLIQALQLAKENTRRQIAEVLGRIKEPTAAPALVDLLQDKSHSVAAAAARALDILGWKPSDPEETVQAAVAKGDFATAVAGGDVAIPLLLTALKTSGGNDWEGAGQALAEIGIKAAAPLLTLVREGDPNLRARALQVLGLIGGDSAVEAMTTVIQDPDPSVRESAVTALWNIGGPKAGAGLVLALKDEDRLIRSRATRALGELGDARAVEPLLALLEKDDDAVKADAALALAKIAPARAVPGLTRLAASPATAEEAIGALIHVLTEASADVTSEDLKNLVGELSGARSSFLKSADPAPLVAAARDELRRRGVPV
jgi:HEAT repeat protein